MGILDDDLLCVMQRFPDQKTRIDKLYLNNEEFRLLCSDYYVCIKTRNGLLRDKDEETAFTEYNLLKLALEREIFNYLDSQQDKSMR